MRSIKEPAPPIPPQLAASNEKGECSTPGDQIAPSGSGVSGNSVSDSHSSDIEPDSSDVSSHHEDDPDYDDEYGGYTKVLSKRQQKLLRGKGPKNL